MEKIRRCCVSAKDNWSQTPTSFQDARRQMVPSKSVTYCCRPPERQPASVSTLVLLGICFIGMLTHSSAALSQGADDMKRWRRAELVSERAPQPHNRLAQKFVQISDKIAAVSKVEAKLIYSPDRVFNAAAFVHDEKEFIVGYAGLISELADDDDALAFVIAHEHAHHLQGHTTQGVRHRSSVGALARFLGALVDLNLERKNSPSAGVGQLGGEIAASALIASFTRDQERDADETAMRLMADAGFDPRGAIRAQKRMQSLSRESWFTLFNTHPNTSERLATLENLLQTDPKLVAKSKSPQDMPGLNSFAVTHPSLETQSSADAKYLEGVALLGRGKSEEGVKLVRQAAYAGSAKAAASYGIYLERGLHGLSQDLGMARKMYELAITRGDASSKDRLSALNDLSQSQVNADARYLEGLATLGRGNAAEGLSLVRQAINMGSARAAGSYAIYLERGLHGLTPDLLEAKKMYEVAASMGDASSKERLSALNDLSHSQGNADARYLEGLTMLSRGNSAEGLSLIRQAINMGSARAAGSYAIYLERGLYGLSPDLPMAKKMYEIAASRGDASSRNQTSEPQPTVQTSSSARTVSRQPSVAAPSCTKPALVAADAPASERRHHANLLRNYGGCMNSQARLKILENKVDAANAIMKEYNDALREVRESR